MKRLYGLIVLLILTQSFLHAQSLMQNFEWLKGEWQMKTQNGMLLENWEHVNDTLLKSSSYFINKKGERKLLENVKLKYTAGTYYYEPVVEDQNNGNAVLFKITRMDGRGFTAENKLHDFPNRIIYERLMLIPLMLLLMMVNFSRN
jgi:hypothetical protein